MNNCKDHIAKVQSKKYQQIPIDYLEPTIDSGLYAKNNLYQFLATYLPSDTISEAFRKYQVGTCNYWKGANLYWLINENSQITHCKVACHNRHNGKIVAPGNTIEQFNPSTKQYEHIVLDKYAAKLFKGFDDYTEKLKLKACFYGAHLVTKYDKRPIVLVQNESSAVIGSIYVPDAIWLAVGDAKFDESNLKLLSNRRIILIPNYGGFNKQLSKFNEWVKKVKQIQESANDINIYVSDVLENTLASRQRFNQTPGEQLSVKNRILIEQLNKKHGLNVKSFKQ